MPHQCTNCGKVFADGSKEMLSGCPECGGNKFQFRPSGSSGDPSSSARADPAPTTDSNLASSARAASSAGSARSGGTAGRGEAPAGDASRPADDSDAESTVRGWVKRRISDRGGDGESGEGDVGGDTSVSGTAPDTTATNSTVTDSTATDSTASSSAAAGGTATGERDVEPSDSGPETAESNPVAPESPAVDPHDTPEDNAQASARSDVVSPSELAEAADDPADAPPSDVDGRVIEPKSDDRPGLDELREELNNQFESIRIISPGQYELNLMELYDRNEYIISLQEDGRYVIEVPDAWVGDQDEE